MPLGIASDGANLHGSKLLEPTIAAAKRQVGALSAKARIHLDCAYNGKPGRNVLKEHALIGEIAAKGVPAPIQVGKRWVTA